MNAIRRARIAHHVRGVIESLESRRLLSTILKTDLEPDGLKDLIITGASNDQLNDIFIYLDPANNRTVIFDDVDNDHNGESLAPSLSLNVPVTTPTNSAQVYVLPFIPETINCSMGSGDDDVVVQLVSDFTSDVSPRMSPLFNGISIYTNMGSGVDKFDFSSPTAADIDAQGANAVLTQDLEFDPDGADIISSDVFIEVEGSSENDKLIANLLRTSINNSNVVINLAGGTGSDTINAALPDQPEFDEGIFASFGTPSRLNLTIRTGGGGSDTSNNTVNLKIRTELESEVEGDNGTFASSADIDIEGDAGRDTVNMNDANPDTSPFFIDTDAGNMFTLDAFLDRGNDNFDALFDWRGFTENLGEPQGIEIERNSFVHFGVSGGIGDDIIDFDNAAPPGSASIPIFGKLEFDLSGGDGKDNISVHFDSKVSDPDSFIRLGSGGEFAALLFGDTGDDFLEIDLKFEPAFPTLGPTSALLDLSIFAGANNDKAVMAVDLGLFDRAGAFNFRGLVLDGGSGTDSYDIDGDINLLFALSDSFLRGFEQEDDNLEPNEVP